MAISEKFVKDDLLNEVEKILGPGLDIEIPEEWYGITDPLEFPDNGEAAIYENGQEVGFVEWRTKYKIERRGDKKHIVPFPEIIYLEYRGYVKVDKYDERVANIELNEQELKILLTALIFWYDPELNWNVEKYYKNLLTKLRSVLTKMKKERLIDVLQY